MRRVSQRAGSPIIWGCRGRRWRWTRHARRRWWPSIWPATACGRRVPRGAGLRRQRNLYTADVISLGKSHMLAPDGRCKTFDAAADGYVRGEGCGVLVLKRLATRWPTAIAILAVDPRHGNQPGRTQQRPDGAKRPGPGSGDPRRARRRRRGSADIDYVEAHGTGTALGDPIEVQSDCVWV